MSDFQGEDLRYSLSFSKIKCEFVLIGSKLVSNRCVILSISSFRVLISKNIVLTRAPPFNFPLVNIYQTSEFNRYFARKWRDLICPSIDGNGSIFKFIFENTRDTFSLRTREVEGRNVKAVFTLSFVEEFYSAW